MTVNILSNALLRGLNGTGRIRTWTKPFDYVSRMTPVTTCAIEGDYNVQTVMSPQQIPDSTAYTLVYIEAIILGMLAAGMPAYFAMDHTQDREVITWDNDQFF